jgi:hypothetical protein
MKFILDNIFKIAFVFSFAVYLIVLLKISFFYFVTIKKWVKIEAEITNSEIEFYRSDKDSDTEGWKEKVTYLFIYNSVIYKGDCITKNLKILVPFKDMANQNNYKCGQKINITYNPNNPIESVIDDKFDLMNIILPLAFYSLLYCFIF